MIKAIKAGLIAGIVMFIWSVVSWMFLSWHMTTIHSFKNEQAVAEVITSNAPHSGIYFMPTMGKSETATSEEQIHQPMIFTAVRSEGMSSMTLPMLTGLLTQIIAAFFVALLLLQANALGYMGRLMFVMVFAVAASLVTNVPYWNWFGFETQYTLMMSADLLIGWFFGGLVLAKICKR